MMQKIETVVIQIKFNISDPYINVRDYNHASQESKERK